MTFNSLVADKGFASMPFGVRLTTAMTGAVTHDYAFAYPTNRTSNALNSLKGLRARFTNWYAARETARQLHALDNRLLMDIGINRSEIDALVHGWK